jgi:hypothetical protein
MSLTLSSILYKAGSVVQVVQGTLTSNESTTSTTPVATGLSASITPSSTSSKIYIMVSGTGENTAVDGAYYTIYRNSTNLAGTSNGFMEISSNSSTAVVTGICVNVLDSPATTSSTTYSLYFWTSGSTAYINSATTSTITLMEIAG